MALVKLTSKNNTDCNGGRYPHSMLCLNPREDELAIYTSSGNYSLRDTICVRCGKKGVRVEMWNRTGSFEFAQWIDAP